ncbi:MAG: hypothetical protein ACI9W2_002897 [Gammaproteobacteria bacterium]|jgi:hypothetical protein
MDHALAAATFNNRIVMRILPQLLPDVGLALTESIAELVSEIGVSSFFRYFAETYAPWRRWSRVPKHTSCAITAYSRPTPAIERPSWRVPR